MWEKTPLHMPDPKGGHLQRDWSTVMKLVMLPNRCHLISSEAFKPQLGLAITWGILFVLSVVSFFPIVINYSLDISLHRVYKSPLDSKKKKQL